MRKRLILKNLYISNILVKILINFILASFDSSSGNHLQRTKIFCTEILYPSRRKKRLGCSLLQKFCTPCFTKEWRISVPKFYTPYRKKRDRVCSFFRNSIPLGSKKNDIFLYQNSIPLTTKKRSGVITYFGIEILYILPWKK